MEGKDEKENVKFLLDISSYGKLKIGKDMCRSILNHQNSFGRLLGTTNFDVFERPQQLESFLELVVAYSSVNLSGETDEPVTTDIKRLIRCPGSLHGKTGMKVMEVNKDDIDDYEPLRDAVALSDDPVKVNVSATVQQYLGGENFSLGPGETEVPLYLAYFLVARRMATLP
jgi:DNA primase small subunit